MPNATSANNSTRCRRWYSTCSKLRPRFGPLMSTPPLPAESPQIEPPDTTAHKGGGPRARPALRSLRKEALTMSAKNVKTLRVPHESWNKRDFAGGVSNAVKGLAYTDHGRNLTLNTRVTFRKWTKACAKAFSH